MINTVQWDMLYYTMSISETLDQYVDLSGSTRLYLGGIMIYTVLMYEQSYYLINLAGFEYYDLSGIELLPNGSLLGVL